MTASSDVGGIGPSFDTPFTGVRTRVRVEFVEYDPPPSQCRSPARTTAIEVRVSSPPWRSGKLRDAIESAIEHVLDALGAPPAGVTSSGDMDATLSDQLYRARSVGALDLVLQVPDLRAAAGPAAALDAEDSAVLRWWIEATSERPVTLVLDARNREIGAYGPPTRLELLVGPRIEVPRGSEHLQVVRIDDPQETPMAPVGPGRAEPPIVAHPAAPEPPIVAHPTAPEPPIVAHPTAPEPRDERRPPRFGRLMIPRQVAGTGEHPTAGPDRPNHVVPIFPRREAAPALSRQAPSIDWRAFSSELELARGPKPLAIVERLYMSRYVPLLEAVARGETDATAQRTVEQWADDFARSYTEGFNALKVTGKRPRMVLDAPQLCNQIARLHGAKSTQLILVDGMRFDVGLRVQERLMQGLMPMATCTERLLLWAALPTTTPAQLDLLARGPEGLTSPGPPSDGEELGVRGRTSTTLRRVKIGPRDVLKLDAVESRLRESGPPLGDRLDAMADEVASAISTHARTQPARTLMFIFGDHGFRMESDEAGTAAATTGGASPEEVLVPAFAWLTGDVH